MAEETATLAGGCFWCIEAAFKELRGVNSAVSGYAGGDEADPSYEQVARGQTGHAEAVQVTYDTDELSYYDILKVFFKVHDPTQLNRQGPDVGEQYRSAVFYHSDEQREILETVIDELDGTTYDGIVTEVEQLDVFYPAEEYHQDYYEKNPQQAYCQMHVADKVDKVNEVFDELTAN